MGLKPARCAQAPPVAGLEARESVLWHRRTEVVAGKTRILQERLCDQHAHRVGSEILVIRIATTIAQKPGQRILAAGQERLAKHIEGLVYLD
jgi:hypothetical protein